MVGGRFWGRDGLWRASSVAAALLAAAFACGGQSMDRPNAAAGGGPGGANMSASGASAGPAQAGSDSNFTLALGGKPTASGGAAGSTPVDPGAAGAAGNPMSEACDAACLHSVVDQKSDFGTTWESSWFLIGCKAVEGSSCVTVAACPHQDASVFEDKGVWTLETFPIGGRVGQRYKVTFKFNAVAGAKYYQNGTRDGGDFVPPGGSLSDGLSIWDGFHRDGDPIPSNYSTWRLSVLDETGKEARHYYMNSFPYNPKTSNYERQQTFLLSYTKSIVVVGGGKVTHRLQESNCYASDNCGALPPSGEGCDSPRNLPNEPADIALPAMYQDPEDHQLKPTLELSSVNTVLNQPWQAQLGHLSVVSVEVTDEPVTHDFR